MICSRFHIRALRTMLALLIPITGFIAHQHHAHLEMTDATHHVHAHQHHHHHGEHAQHPAGHVSYHAEHRAAHPEHQDERTEHHGEHDHQPVNNFLQLMATAGTRPSLAVHAVPFTGTASLSAACMSLSTCVPNARTAFSAGIPTPRLQQQAILRCAANLSPPSLG